MSDELLELGAAAAFGPAPEESVLSAIERVTGEAPRVRLREAEAPGSAIIDPLSTECRATPQTAASYQVLGEIARGGMGVVLKGIDHDLGRDVALKVLHPEFARRPDAVQRFVEEAQIAGQLQHPGIVPVYQLGLMADERPYFAMKLVKGRTLAAIFAERQRSEDEFARLLDVFGSVCQTVAYAHSRGVIHRDLKPSNVMVGAFAEVQVLDWGLAKVLARGGVHDERRARQASAPEQLHTVRTQDVGSRSLAGSVMGTAAYMSPEQATGRIAELDERTDVFALGAILCELLTGAPPYGGTREKALLMAARAELGDALRRLESSGHDAQLVALSKACLAAERSERPSTASVVAERLRAWKEGVEQRARDAQLDAAEARVRVAAERKQRRLAVGLAGSVVAIVLVVAAGWAWARVQRDRRESATNLQIEPALADAQAALAANDWNAAETAIARAEAALGSGESSPAAAERVELVASRVRAEVEAARARAALARKTAAFLEQLDHLRQRSGVNRSTSRQVRERHTEAFARAFRDQGIDAERMSRDEAAAAIAATGNAMAISAALDSWAANLLGVGDSARGAELLELAIAVDPDQLRARIRRAIVKRDFVELAGLAATPGIEQADPMSIAALARALLVDRRLATVITLLRSAWDRAPGDFQLAFLLGGALVDSGEVAESLRYFSAACALRPKDAAALAGLAHALGSLGENERALAYFQRAADIDPERIDVWNGMATLTTDTAQQITYIERALAVDPNSIEPRANLGILMHRVGRLEESIQHLRRAVELAPKFAVGWYYLGVSLVSSGEREQANDCFRRALEINPDYAEARAALAGELPSSDER